MMLADKMKAVDTNISITRYDNGWTIEVGGTDSEGGWVTSKLICPTEEELFDIIKEWNSLKLSN